MGFLKKMYCSCLLLFFSYLMVFSNVDTASVHKRGLLPSNINIDIKLGKGSTAKSAETVPPADGSHKTVLNAPFGLASLTITTNRKNSSSSSPIKEPGKPCNSDSEYIETNHDSKPPHYGGLSSSDTLGGKGGAFFGPPHPPPHSEFGPPSHDFHHPHPDSHYPPPPSSHHFHHYPPPPPPHHPHHHHHPDCQHGEFFPSITSSTEIPFVPESKPDAKITTAQPPKEKIPPVTSLSSTTQNVDELIDSIFSGGSNGSSSSTVRSNIDVNDREQTGEGTLDIRMPTSAPSKRS